MLLRAPGHTPLRFSGSVPDWSHAPKAVGQQQGTVKDANKWTWTIQLNLAALYPWESHLTRKHFGDAGGCLKLDVQLGIFEAWKMRGLGLQRRNEDFLPLWSVKFPWHFSTGAAAISQYKQLVPECANVLFTRKALENALECLCNMCGHSERLQYTTGSTGGDMASIVCTCLWHRWNEVNKSKVKETKESTIVC